MPGKGAVALALALGAWLAESGAFAAPGPDGVDLRVAKGPDPQGVTLQWSGGLTPYAVFRCESPVDLTQPANYLGQTTGNAWLDVPPAGGIFFYLVQGGCDFDPPEICDGLDNDCDAATPDGVEDPQVGTPCDGVDSDLCLEGTHLCTGGALACSDATAGSPDLCNGVDDDCDPASADGAEDPQVGPACDGEDSDLCLEGSRICVSGTLACSDLTGGTPDLCNGVDDDCDPASADGAEDPQVGTWCDGGDTDLCLEGTRFCSSGSLSCGDLTGNTLDLCEGTDDDCDPASPDGSEDPQVGTPCDGTDSDLCIEGSRTCASGTLACTDASGSSVDLCNGADDDCDPVSADGAEDPRVGALCDGGDGDLCLEGVGACPSGSLTCTDATGTTVEVCAGNAVDEDCDGAIDEGFERNDNPACSPTPVLGAVSGDTGGDHLSVAHWNEEWRRVTVREDSLSSLYISAMIRLWSPPGTDFDLYVYCVSCGGTPAGSSAAGGMEGHYDTVHVRADDTWILDDDFDVIIEVRHWGSDRCASWVLEVFGNTSTATTTCD